MGPAGGILDTQQGQFGELRPGRDQVGVALVPN